MESYREICQKCLLSRHRKDDELLEQRDVALSQAMSSEMIVASFDVLLSNLPEIEEQLNDIELQEMGLADPDNGKAEGII